MSGQHRDDETPISAAEAEEIVRAGAAMIVLSQRGWLRDRPKGADRG